MKEKIARSNKETLLVRKFSKSHLNAVRKNVKYNEEIQDRNDEMLANFIFFFSFKISYSVVYMTLD